MKAKHYNASIILMSGLAISIPVVLAITLNTFAPIGGLLFVCLFGAVALGRN